MSTILEALRKLQQDGPRKAPSDASPEEPSNERSEAETKTVVEAAADPPAATQKAPPSQAPESPIEQAKPEAPPSELPEQTAPPERGDWLRLLDANEGVEPEPTATAPESDPESDQEENFAPIEDPEELDAFVNRGTERSADQVPRPGSGDDWRDHQPEPFEATPAPAPPETDEPGEGLGPTESALLWSGSAEGPGATEDGPGDDGPSIYEETEVSASGVSGARTAVIALAALALGSLVGFYVVQAFFGSGEDATTVAAVVPERKRPAENEAAGDKVKAKKPAKREAGKPEAKPRPSAGAKADAAPKAGAVAGKRPVPAVPTPVAALPPTALPQAPAVPPAPLAVAPILPPLAPEPEPVRTVASEPPAGAPHVDLVFVQWAKAPAKRLVSLRNIKGTLLVLREGDFADPAAGMKVSAIGRDWVDFEWKSQLFRVGIRSF